MDGVLLLLLLLQQHTRQESQRSLLLFLLLAPRWSPWLRGVWRLMARFDRALLPTRNNNSYFSNNVNQIFKPLAGGGEDPRISLIVLNYQRCFCCLQSRGSALGKWFAERFSFDIKKKKKSWKNTFFFIVGIYSIYKYTPPAAIMCLFIVFIQTLSAVFL